jgi:uncharacterized membrane protein YedE/YeeE
VSRTVWFLLPGAIFGAGLALSGMTNPAKVTGFLELFGAWDPSLACVMTGAIVSFVVGSAVVRRRSAPLLGGSFPGRPAHAFDARLWIGSGLFGIGWGLVGFCPGPAITNLGGLHWEALAFVVVMALGMIVAQRVFDADP